MELAEVNATGQITIPTGIREKLGIREGSNVLFIEEDGRVYIANPSIIAWREAQKAFKGEAERLGLRNDDDVVNMIKEFRREKAG